VFRTEAESDYLSSFGGEYRHSCVSCLTHLRQTSACSFYCGGKFSSGVVGSTILGEHFTSFTSYPTRIVGITAETLLGFGGFVGRTMGDQECPAHCCRRIMASSGAVAFIIAAHLEQRT